MSTQRTVERLTVPEGPRLAVIIHKSDAPGPRVAITANVHGDELTGTGVVLDVDEWLSDHLERGEVVLYPSLNPAGLASSNRMVPDDAVDLNRVFPGDARGGPSARLASTIWTDLQERGPDVLVDLHADSHLAVPYAIVDRPVAVEASHRPALARQLDALATHTGLTALREYPREQYLRYALNRSLSGAMVNRAGTLAVTLEVGPRGALDPQAVDIGRGAVRNVLVHLGNLDGVIVPDPSRVEGGPWRRSTTPRTRRSGLFRPRISPGEAFSAGDVLGTVTALSGEGLEVVRATSAGVLIAWMDGSWVSAGGVAGTVGLAE